MTQSPETKSLETRLTVRVGRCYHTRSAGVIGPVQTQLHSERYPFFIPNVGNFDAQGRFNGQFDDPNDLMCEYVAEVRDHATAPPQSVPEGWRLVPVEPTLEMRQAGLRALCEEIERSHKIMDAPLPPDAAAEVAQIMAELNASPDTIEVEMEPAEIAKRHRRFGALMRNSNETDAVYRAMLSASPTPQPVGGGDGAKVTPLPGAYIKFLPGGRMEIGNFHLHDEGDLAIGMANLVRDSLTAAGNMPVPTIPVPDGVDLDALGKDLPQDEVFASNMATPKPKKVVIDASVVWALIAEIRSLRQSTATKGPGQ